MFVCASGARIVSRRRIACQIRIELWRWLDLEMHGLDTLSGLPHSRQTNLSCTSSRGASPATITLVDNVARVQHHVHIGLLLHLQNHSGA
jgi:hypothetical protein